MELEITSKDYKAIKDLASTPNTDFITLKSDGDNQIQFIVYNSELIKVFTMTTNNNNKIFNIRVLKESLLSSTREGTLKMEITDNKVSFLCVKKGYQVPTLGCTVDRQKDIDTFLSTVNKIVEHTKHNQGFIINNIQNISKSLGFTKTTKTGVVLSGGLAICSGTGYRVSCYTGCDQLNVGLTTLGLETLVKYKQNKLMVWDYSNYLIFQTGDLTIGVRRANISPCREMEELLKLSPLFTVEIDHQDLSEFLKGIKLSGKDNTSIEFNFSTRVISVKDRNYGLYKMLLMTPDTYQYKIDINLETLSKLIPYMKSKYAIQLKVFNNFICLESTEGIKCFINGEGDYIVGQ